MSGTRSEVRAERREARAGRQEVGGERQGLGSKRSSLHVKDRVAAVDGTQPALRRDVECVLLAYGEVELGAQWMQEQVNLVHDEAAALIDLHHLDQRAKVDLHAGVMLATRVPQHIHLEEG